MSHPIGKLDAFAAALPKGLSALAPIRDNVVGKLATLKSPAGEQPIRYADYAASGRSSWLVEKFLLNEVLPFYANPHTQASHCGSVMNAFRRDARQIIRDAICADDDVSVIFTHGGATEGLNRLASLLTKGLVMDDVVVLIGPYEHHSNILPWRESGARVIEITESTDGGPSLAQLEQVLSTCSATHIIGAFSAASNVTGILTDVAAVSAILKRHGALSVWDYAAAAPYVDIDMKRDQIDAMVFSPHKFLGGPGASGILAVRDALVAKGVPTSPGGGTVSFVSPWSHHYHDSLQCREESGTPDAIGDIRAALAIAIKEAVGATLIEQRECQYLAKVAGTFAQYKRIELLGNVRAQRLPILSFRIKDGNGNYVHHQLVTRLLSDEHGVQARGGCACAGPYAHRLLGIDEMASANLERQIAAGNELAKPGWCRISLHYSMTPEEVDAIAGAVVDIANRAAELAERYQADAAAARFTLAPVNRDEGL